MNTDSLPTEYKKALQTLAQSAHNPESISKEELQNAIETIKEHQQNYDL